MRNFIRALRLPFITASILPFIAGTILAKDSFSFATFLLGLICVACMHLGANLLNDYSDSKYGADWQDKNYYNFFGGSKLIQEGLLSEGFYLKTALLFLSLSSACVLILAAMLNNIRIIFYFAVILLLGFSYSHKPLKLSYRGLGEITIFILFGPALVMGAYFIQTQIFPTLEGFILSIPFGLLTASILLSNEIPDMPDDKKSEKFTLIAITGQKHGWILYGAVFFSGFLSILPNVAINNIKPFSLIALIFLAPALKAVQITKKHSHDKYKLMESSKITIQIQTFVSIIIILGALL